MNAALWAEWTKTTRALTPQVVAAAVVLGPLAVAVGLLAAAAGGGNPAIDAQLAPFSTGTPWADLATVTSVVCAAGGILGFGTLLAWMFGREFTEGTVSGLFACSVPLTRVAAAKLVVYAGYVLVVATLVALGLVAGGLLLGYGTPSTAELAGPAKSAAVVALTGLVATPCAWAATAGRSILAPVGVAVALLVGAQLSVLAGAGAWLPFAAPGAWAGLAGVDGGLSPTPVQLLLVLPTGAAFAALTVRRWHHLRL